MALTLCDTSLDVGVVGFGILRRVSNLLQSLSNSYATIYRPSDYKFAGSTDQNPKALKALKKKRLVTLADAATHYYVPISTLSDRRKGKKSRAVTRQNNHLLTKCEEISLLKQIFSMDRRGAARLTKTVKIMATLLSAKRGCETPKKVDSAWVRINDKIQKESKVSILEHSILYGQRHKSCSFR